jgi:putative transposase
MSRPPRRSGFDYLGLNRYSLTFCVRARKQVFVTHGTVATTLMCFRETATQERFSVLAYCLMPDHTHLLVEGLEDRSNLRRFAKLAKQRSGSQHKSIHGERLWQEGYYDHVLRSDESATAIARYILENPVRAGLVTHPSEYPYLGSDVWTLEDLLESLP